MISMKSLSALTVLLPLLVTLLPSVPIVNAQGTGSEIAINPASNIGAVTTSFTVNVTLSNVPSLTGYDVVVNYNQTVLLANSVAVGDWCNGLTCFTVVNDISQGTGQIELSQVVLGVDANIVSSSLFSISFTYQSSGSTPITISSVVLTGIVGGVVQQLPAPTVVNGSAMTPPAATASLIKWKARPDFRTLNITHDGDIQTLNANIANTGSNIAYVSVQYIIVSVTGTVTIENSPISSISVGGTTLNSVSYAVPLLNIKYLVEARLMVSGDGIHFNFSGSSKTFHYDVVFKP